MITADIIMIRHVATLSLAALMQRIGKSTYTLQEVPLGIIGLEYVHIKGPWSQGPWAI